MSTNSINYGMITQLFTSENTNTNTNTNTSNFNLLNCAIGTKVMHFSYNTLNLSHDFDCYIPNTLIINLYTGQTQQLNESETEYINNISRLFHKMRLVLQISEQPVLQLPLSLLHELKRTELHDGKLYIRIPFESLFDKINMIELMYSSVSFLLLDTHEISNYSNSFSLITKIYIHNEHDRTWIFNNRNSSNNFIQQIGTLYISVPPNENLSTRRTFQIQTNMLNGHTKGFLIQCSVADLTSIKFYLNNLLRFEYDRYLILNACIKLTDNLLYMPFNDHNDFLDRGIHTFSGAINLSRLQNSTLSLQFTRDQPVVIIHNVYFNYLRQINGLSGLSSNYIPAFIENSTYNHPIQPIVGTPPNSAMLDMSGNYIINRDSYNYINSSYYNNSTYGRTGSNHDNFNRNYINNYVSGTSGSAGSAGSAEPIIYSVPNGSIIYQVINPERNVCNITHDEITTNERYMSCSNCQIHFLETAIKLWLRQRSPSTRTCPTCREVWTNFNVYINGINSINQTSELD